MEILVGLQCLSFFETTFPDVCHYYYSRILNGSDIATTLLRKSPGMHYVKHLLVKNTPPSHHVKHDDSLVWIDLSLKRVLSVELVELRP
jgi:hypothetical protein